MFNGCRIGPALECFYPGSGMTRFLYLIAVLITAFCLSLSIWLLKIQGKGTQELGRFIPFPLPYSLQMNRVWRQIFLFLVFYC